MSFKKYDVESGRIGQKEGRAELLDEKSYGNRTVDKSNLGSDHNRRGSAYSQKNNQTHENALHDYSNNNAEHSSGCVASPTVQFMIRLVLILVALFGIALASFTPSILPHTNVDWFRDMLFEMTTDINLFLALNPDITHGCMIFWALFMDILFIIAFAVFVILGKTYRLPVAFALFYGLRIIIQKTFIMEYPKGYIWEYPGFPSLVGK